MLGHDPGLGVIGCNLVVRSALIDFAGGDAASPARGHASWVAPTIFMMEDILKASVGLGIGYLHATGRAYLYDDDGNRIPEPADFSIDRRMAAAVFSLEFRRGPLTYGLHAAALFSPDGLREEDYISASLTVSYSIYRHLKGR